LKIITIVGARPQFVKAAVVSKAFDCLPRVDEILLHTGQHFDGNMSQIFFDELGICAPKYNLSISGGYHGAQTGRMLEKVEEVLIEEMPDLVLVYGDTNSTLAGALAASKLHIPIAHIEAGLRSFNRRMPEEINRIMTDHLSDLLFAPTEIGLRNLRNEGIAPEKCHYVGDVMYDASIYFGQRAEDVSSILNRLGLASKEYILATIHRAENTDDGTRLNAILDSFLNVAEDIPIVLPLHPRTKAAIEANGLLRRSKFSTNIILTDPIGYLDMIMLEKNALLIATDSGGVQKEAFIYKVPCVTLRDETEWTELVELGWNTVVSPLSGSVTISNTIREKMATKGVAGSPYGEGDASKRIAAEISKRYGVAA